MQRYAEPTARGRSHIGYYEVLGVFNLAVILQQIYYRFRRGRPGTRASRTSAFKELEPIPEFNATAS